MIITIITSLKILDINTNNGADTHAWFYRLANLSVEARRCHSPRAKTGSS